MPNLLFFYEYYTDGFNFFFLVLFSVASILCGILVIISKNPIVSVLFLIGLFFNIASYLMMLGINFLGISYLLVYVGAVSILFLFILMLINIRVSELITDTSNSIPLAVLIGIFFNLTLLNFNVINSTHGTGDISKLMRDLYVFTFKDLFNTYVVNQVLFATSQTWDAILAELSHIISLGNILYTGYPLWLIITGIILLLGMVGSIIITIKQ